MEISLIILCVKFDATIPSSTMLRQTHSGYKNQMVLGMVVELQRVGNIPQSADDDKTMEESLSTFITGGDITRDGTKVFLRNSNSMFKIHKNNLIS